MLDRAPLRFATAAHRLIRASHLLVMGGNPDQFLEVLNPKKRPRRRVSKRSGEASRSNESKLVDGQSAPADSGGGGSPAGKDKAKRGGSKPGGRSRGKSGGRSGELLSAVTNSETQVSHAATDAKQRPGKPHPRARRKQGDETVGTASKTGNREGAKNKKPRRAGGPGRSAPSLRVRVVELLGDEPQTAKQLIEKLAIPRDAQSSFVGLLGELEKRGELARIRGDHYIVPEEADLFTGEIQFHASGAAHVLNETKGEADLFVSPENTWTAMHGDRVVARISKERPGRAPRETGRREGRVIRILERANETIVGTLQRSKKFFYVVADDPRFVHNLYVSEPEIGLNAKAGDKVVAKLEDWPSRHVNPEGRVVEVLGRTGAPGVDMLAIIRKYRLPQIFPDAVLDEAGAVPDRVDEAEAAKREDLRGREIITIDPDDAKDFDDAIEVQKTAKGWTVSVHIADVSHYVRPKSQLDREAVERGNSVYLVDRVIPMLPESLSNGICSLKPGVDRLAFSVFAEISASGKVLKSRFAKTVIRSAARLTYKEALGILQKPAKDAIGERVHAAWELASLLRTKRFEKGSLELDFPEIKVWLDEDGRPARLEKIENDISHQLIEEFMLLANELVARHLKLERQAAIYRIHEDPDPDKLAEYREIALSYGVPCGDLTKRGELKRLLSSVKGKAFESALKIALLKSLKRASYSPEPLGHFGLAKPDYTHFTSPIRRYADLIVHRSLARQLGITKSGPQSNELGSMAEHISGTERVATEAERESTKLKKLEFFQAQIVERKGQSFAAQIVDVRNYGMLVELPDFLLTGLVHVSTLDGDFFTFDAARARFVGRKTKVVYAIGQMIEVIVARVDTFKQQVDFKLVSAKG